MDWGVIQAPEVLARLQRFLGLRQAHIAPTLNEGVQPVVIIGDVSREAVPGERKPQLVMAGLQLTGAGAGSRPCVQIWNPADSGRILRPWFIKVTGNTGGFERALTLRATREVPAGMGGNICAQVEPGDFLENFSTHWLGGNPLNADAVGTGLSVLVGVYTWATVGGAPPIIDIDLRGIILAPGTGIRLNGDSSAGERYDYHAAFTVEPV